MSKKKDGKSTELTLHVQDALAASDIRNPEAITVAADKSRVLLQGTVGDFLEKEKAEKVASSVNGVKEVTNKLSAGVASEQDEQTKRRSQQTASERSPKQGRDIAPGGGGPCIRI